MSLDANDIRLQHGMEALVTGLLPALLRPQLPLSQDWLGGSGALDTEECSKSTPVKPPSISHPLWGPLKMLILVAPPEPLPGSHEEQASVIP